MTVEVEMEYLGANDFGQSLDVRERIACFRSCLDALVRLKDLRTIHGNIRPEFIHFSRDKRLTKIVDRVGDSVPSLQRQ